MQFEVEATGVAHGLSVGVASPQRRRARVTVGAERPGSLADNLEQGSQFISAAGVTHFNSNLTAVYWRYWASNRHTSRFFGRISGLFWPFILWYSPQALHR